LKKSGRGIKRTGKSVYENNWRAIGRWMERFGWWQEKRDICSLRRKGKWNEGNED